MSAPPRSSNDDPRYLRGQYSVTHKSAANLGIDVQRTVRELLDLIDELDTRLYEYWEMYMGEDL